MIATAFYYYSRAIMVVNSPVNPEIADRTRVGVISQIILMDILRLG